MTPIQLHDLDRIAGGTTPGAPVSRRASTEGVEMPVCPVVVPFPES